MSSYATIEDVIALWRALTPDETTRAEALLPLVSDALRQAAHNAGRDLDQMIEDSPTLGSVAKIVTVDIIARILRTSTSGDIMSQESQAGLGYSWSGTYAIPGGGIANAIMYNDLKRLGISRQKYGVIDLYDSRHNNSADG